MPAVTRSRSQSNLGQDSQKSSSEQSATSMPGAFDQEESYDDSTLLQKLEAEAEPPVEKSVKKLATNLDKMALETTSLNLSEHPAHELLNLPEQRVFNDFAGFRHIVAETTDGPRVFRSLSKLVEYDITTHQKMTEQYAQWNSVKRAKLAKQKKMQKEIDRLSRKLGQTSQELDQTNEQLVTSRDKYTGMQEELDQVKEKLRSTQVQLTKERSMLGAQEQDKLIDGERSQRFELLDELQEVNKENAILRKQLADGVASVASVASVANVANNPVSNYRPRGIGPKKQLIGTDPSAFAPWKWAVNDKFHVDSVIFPTEEDKISYAFYQLDQPIFQQLNAWIRANSDSLSMDGFYQQIKHCMGIHILVEKAEDKLHVITMKPSEPVDDYYQQIFKLWQQAKTPERERIRRFEITLKLSIAHALIGQKHTKIMDVLEAARDIEHRKNQISTKFARDSAKPF